MKKMPVVWMALFAICLGLFGHGSIAEAKEDSSNLNIESSFVPSNPDQFIEERGWEKPTPDAKLVEVVHVRNSNASPPVSTIEPTALGTYVKRAGGISDLCGSMVRARVSGTGSADGLLELIQTVKVSNNFSANVDVSSSKITSGVGFDVTDSWESQAKRSVETKGKEYQIVAYDDYLGHNFEVWHNPLIGSEYKLGTGVALQQIGFCFAVYEL